MWFERVEFTVLGFKNPNILGVNDVIICLLLFFKWFEMNVARYARFI